MTRSPRRYVAPAALAAVAAATVLVVSNGSGGGSQSKGSSTNGSSPSHGSTRRTYRIRNGDSLSTISARTGVSIVELEQLNPNVDPNALHPGQRIRLRR